MGNEGGNHMPRRPTVRYCRCNARLAADNPGDRCLACIRKDQEYLLNPPDLPLEHWLTDRFDDAFAAQHIGLVSAAYRNSPYHRRPITQDQLGTWLGMSQPDVSRIESGPPIRNLDRLAYLARTIQVPPQLLWFDLPGQRRAVFTGHDRQAAPLETADSQEQRERSVDGHGQRLHGDERPDQAGHDHGLVIPDHLAALLEAREGLPASGLTELLAGTGGLLPITGLTPVGSPSPPGTSPSLPSSLSGLLATPSTGRSLSFEAGRYQVIARFGEVLLVAFDRRLFLVRAGLAPGLALPLADAEGTRHGLIRSMAGDGRGTVEEWQAIVHEYCTALGVPPAEKFARLSADLDALGEVFDRERSETGQSELRKAGAILTRIMSSTVASLGDLPGCLRWARTARHLADASGDLHTRIWVRGGEVVMGLYQQRPVDELLRIAEEAVALGQTQGPPRTFAWPKLMGATAQALAVAGRKAEAETALQRTRDSFSTLPGNPRTSSLLSYSERNLYYTEGYVYTYIDEYDKADAAQDAVLRLYAPEDQRNPAQVKLMQALCQVRAGDTKAGVAHARETVGQLPQMHRIHTVIDLGRKVLEAVPVWERTGDEVVGLRELVRVR